MLWKFKCQLYIPISLHTRRKKLDSMPETYESAGVTVIVILETSMRPINGSPMFVPSLCMFIANILSGSSMSNWKKNRLLCIY